MQLKQTNSSATLANTLQHIVPQQELSQKHNFISKNTVTLATTQYGSATLANTLQVYKCMYICICFHVFVYEFVYAYEYLYTYLYIVYFTNMVDICESK